MIVIFSYSHLCLPNGELSVSRDISRTLLLVLEMVDPLWKLRTAGCEMPVFCLE